MQDVGCDVSGRLLAYPTMWVSTTSSCMISFPVNLSVATAAAAAAASAAVAVAALLMLAAAAAFAVCCCLLFCGRFPFYM